MKQSEKIVGREEEKRLLEKLFCSERAEFLAVYGRRRVGKTYLVRNYFRNKGVFFEITGSFNRSPKDQLANFYTEFKALFDSAKESTTPKNWRDAFARLVKAVEMIEGKQKVILFFDELPWLSSGKSDFLSAVDYAWNRHFSSMPNVLLIVSGSAASWMIHHVVNNTGGLYGRLSAHLRLLPFTLYETRKYLQMREILLTDKQICEVYMVTGGVPKYLSYLERGLSAAQNIHMLCFTPQAPLLTEFHKLYHSLFQKAEMHLQIIRVLAKKRRGMSRSELLEKAKLTNSGRTSIVLQELEESGFITKLSRVGKKSKNSNYYLSDEYTLFYLRWIEDVKSELLRGIEPDYWIKKQSGQSFKSWAGFAFETLCLKHLSQIKSALQIGGVNTQATYWSFEMDGKKEIEIDLVIDRADQCVNLCEIKFCQDEYAITKAYVDEVTRKKTLFAEKAQTKKALFMTLISPFGGVKNANFQNIIDQEIKLDALFLKQ